MTLVHTTKQVFAIDGDFYISVIYISVIILGLLKQINVKSPGMKALAESWKLKNWKNKKNHQFSGFCCQLKKYPTAEDPG